MKNFQSFGALAKALRRNQVEMEISLTTAMEVAAIAVTGTAKAELGTYQREDMGESKPWEELKQATKDDRVRHGYSENDPLLRSGGLWASIEYQVIAARETTKVYEFVVGSEDPVANYQEMGTPKLSPRHFLAPALYRNVPFIKKTIGEAIEKALSGEV